MDESDDESDERIVRQQTLNKEMNIHLNRGFHDGYDESIQLNINRALDHGYNLAYEQHFILSTLKGVAFGLISSKSPETTKDIPEANSNTSPEQPPTTSNDRDLAYPSLSSPTPKSTITTAISNRKTFDEHQVELLNSILIRIDKLQRIIMSQLTENNKSSTSHLSYQKCESELGELNDIKQDLIKICKDNRFEILAHYVSEIG